MIEHVSGVLIAGGRSRRMGQDKRFLRVAGVSVFDHILCVMQEMFPENIVILAEPIDGLEMRGCSVAYDVVKGAGSLGGLLTGLITATRPRVFAVACDMPFLDADVVRFMSSQSPNADVVAAHLDGRFHPLHAVYSKRCVPILQAMVERQDLKIQGLFSHKELQISVLTKEDFLPFSSGLRSFQNVNTPHDLASAERSSSFQQ